jgi:ATP-dependent Zn protease
MAKKCACIIESEKLKSKFEGVDLPVECLVSSCNGNIDPSVYRRNVDGGHAECNTSICQQVIKLHGSAIYSQGVQNLTCNNQKYSTSQSSTTGSETNNTNTNSQTDASNIGLDPNTKTDKPSINITYLLWFCLVVVVIHCIIFGIMFFVLKSIKNRIEKETKSSLSR